MEIARSILLYPGLALALILGLLFGWLVVERAPFGRPRALPFSAAGLSGVVSILLAALALALLPWPLHPAAGRSWIASSNPLLFWCALEGAFLAPALPGLLAPPFGARAASREAQIGLAGRFVIWLALGTALWVAGGWRPELLPGRALAALAGLMALPAATGTGPFGPERSLAPAGAEEGLDEMTAGLLRFARAVRGAVVLAALLVASLPLTLFQPWVALLLIAALFMLIALLLRRLASALPRLTLPGALRWCWWRALPTAIVALIYLIVA